MEYGSGFLVVLGTAVGSAVGLGVGVGERVGVSVGVGGIVAVGWAAAVCSILVSKVASKSGVGVLGLAEQDRHIKVAHRRGSRCFMRMVGLRSSGAGSDKESV